MPVNFVSSLPPVIRGRITALYKSTALVLDTYPRTPSNFKAIQLGILREVQHAKDFNHENSCAGITRFNVVNTSVGDNLGVRLLFNASDDHDESAFIDYSNEAGLVICYLNKHWVL